MSERDQFEEAWIAANSDSKEKADKVRDALRNIWRDNGSGGGAYFDSFVMMAWTWWKASREALKAEQGYPEKLPCPVILEPGLRFGKGVATKAMLGALLRRAERNAERDAMTPEQREEEDAAIRSILNLSPIDTTPNQYDALGKGGEQ